MKRPHQIFPLREIDTRLASQTRIHHRQQSRGRIHPLHPAHKRRRREPGQIPDHPAANCNHDPVTIQPVFEERVVQPADGVKRFVLFTGR